MAPNIRMSVRISVGVTIIAKIDGTKPPTHIEDIATPVPHFNIVTDLNELLVPVFL